MEPQVTPEEQQIITIGNQFHALVKQPAWKLLLDELERWADTALTDLKNTKYAEHVIIINLVQRWREREFLVKEVEDIVLSAINRRDDLAKELIVRHGGNPERVDDFFYKGDLNG